MSLPTMPNSYGYYYIPTIVTDSVAHNKLMEPTCRFVERLSISYILLRSRSMRDKILTVALALGIAGAATYGIVGLMKLFKDYGDNTVSDLNKEKLKGQKIKNALDANEANKRGVQVPWLTEAAGDTQFDGTKIELTNNERLFVYSATFIVDGIESIFDTSAEYYVSKTRKIIPSASFLRVSISKEPFLICFKEEYEQLTSHQNIEHEYNAIIIDTIQDSVRAIIRIKDGDKIETETSLTSLKRSVGETDLNLKKLPTVMKNVRVS